jgi:hypothetical protein
MNATYAFIFNGSNDWKKSIPEDWDWDIVELDGTEKVLGHRPIDGSTFKVLMTNDGKLVAVAHQK